MARLDIDKRRAQLLEIGLELFASRSYASVRIDDIAEAAGISRGLLYHYFSGKRDLYIATVRHAADRLLQAIDPNPEEDGPTRVRTSLDAYLDFVEGRADAYRALMEGGLGGDPVVQQVIEGARNMVITHIATNLGLSELRPAFRVALRAWIGAVEATSLDWIRHGRDNRRAYLVELLVTALGTHLDAAIAEDPQAGIMLDPPTEPASR